jgi:hypothetical protein
MRILLLVFLIFFASCTVRTGVQKELSGSDSLVVNFFDTQTYEISKTVTTTEKKAINELSRFVDGKELGLKSCNYDGFLLFFKSDSMIANVGFHYNHDSCQVFVIKKDHNSFDVRSMSKKAADFMKSLAEGRSWY